MKLKIQLLPRKIFTISIFLWVLAGIFIQSSSVLAQAGYPYSIKFSSTSGTCESRGDKTGFFGDGLYWCVPNTSESARERVDSAGTRTGECPKAGFNPTPVALPPGAGKIIWCLPSAQSVKLGEVTNIQCPVGSNPYYEDKGVVMTMIEGNPPLYCVQNILENQCVEKNRLRKDSKYIGCIIDPISIEYEKKTYNAGEFQYKYKVNYPLPCGQDTCPDQNTLAGYIANIYQYSLMVVGLLAFAMIVYAGIKYTVSAGNTTAQADARSIITNAMWGILLLFGAYLILRTINPALVSLKNPDRTIVDFGKLSQPEQPTYIPDSNNKLPIGENQTETAKVIDGCALAINTNLGLKSDIKNMSQAIGGSICLKCKPGFVKDANGTCTCPSGYASDGNTCKLPTGPLDNPNKYEGPKPLEKIPVPELGPAASSYINNNYL